MIVIARPRSVWPWRSSKYSGLPRPAKNSGLAMTGFLMGWPWHGFEPIPSLLKYDCHREAAKRLAVAIQQIFWIATPCKELRARNDGLFNGVALAWVRTHSIVIKI